MKAFIPVERIENSIILIRGEKIMLDADLAILYGVSTKRLNEQVKRNRDRFPKDFMFQLTENEKAEVVANCDHLKRLKFSPNLPYAFTEHGAIMLAAILNSPVAVQASIQVVRAFVKLRELLFTNKELAHKQGRGSREEGQVFILVKGRGSGSREEGQVFILAFCLYETAFALYLIFCYNFLE